MNSRQGVGGTHVRLAVGSAHARLKAVSAGTGEHFVNAKDVERVDANPQVEGLLPRAPSHVLVASDSRSFERFGRDLLLLETAG